MDKELKMENQSIPYSIKISRRARRMRISVYPVTCQKCSGPDKMARVNSDLPDYAASEACFGVGCNSGVVVTLPWGQKGSAAERFVKSRLKWILKAREYFSQFKGRTIVKSDRGGFLKHRQDALELAEAKLEHWNRIYNFSYNRVSIRKAKTRWGSCSKKGNLNFNYKIIRLPLRLTDYLVVHELCHLKEFNHSKNFWDLVGRTVPDYKKLRRELKNFGVGLS